MDSSSSSPSHEAVPVPDVAGFGERLRRVIDASTGGNVAAFARRCQTEYPELAPRREDLRNYLERGSVPGADKIYVISMVSGRSFYWLIAGHGPDRLPPHFRQPAREEEAADGAAQAGRYVSAPYYRLEAGRLAPVADQPPFLLMENALPPTATPERLIAMETTHALRNDRLGLSLGSVLLATLYDAAGLPLPDAVRHEETLPTAVYLIKAEGQVRLLHLTAPPVRTASSHVEVRDFDPAGGAEPPDAFLRAGPLPSLSDLTVYARVECYYAYAG